MITLREYCEFISRASDWHALLAEHGVERGACADAAEHGVAMGDLGVCYMNATHRAWGRGELTYVQGVAMTGKFPVPMEHAWCELPDGTVIDPTWSDGSAYLGVAIGGELVFEWLDRVQVYGRVDAELIDTLRSQRANRVT